MRAYMPFLHVLKDFPHVKMNIHFSGFLFSWIAKHKAEYVELLKTLKDRGQVEIVSGGMYEPILALLTEDDAVDQITMHQEYMADIFGGKPRGIWLTERVYEPHLPKILARAGVSYTVVDDNHFKALGMQDDELFGYFITEHGGSPVYIFPGLEFLRYAIPFKPVNIIDRYFRDAEAAGRALAVFGDDGEKFGLWPGTYNSVYGEKWLERFFLYLTENRSWLETVTLGECLSAVPPKGPVYLDCASYKEMGEWCLPASVSRHYTECRNTVENDFGLCYKGGYFKHFLVKYPESNDMHKKMYRVAEKARGNAEAQKHVFMAQCNDAYWHGVFGGLYLPHLRSAIYHHLIEAEKIIEPRTPFAGATISDINFDGHDEGILESNRMQACFLLGEGGALYELDYKPATTNIMATLSRRYEAYHEKVKAGASSGTADGATTIHDLVLSKEKDLDEYLHYDWHRRVSLVDHVLGKDVTFGEFYRGIYVEPGDFVKEPYGAVAENRKDSASLLLKREGHYWSAGRRMPLTISKEIVLEKSEDTLYANYVITGDLEEDLLLGIEFNFSFLGSGGDRYGEAGGERFALSTRGTLPASQVVRLRDPYQGVEVSLEFGTPQEMWTFPVEVVSLSESGFEKNYQSTMIMPLWALDLRSGPQRLSVTIRLQQI